MSHHNMLYQIMTHQMMSQQMYRAYLEPLKDTSNQLYQRVQYLFDLLETVPYDYLASHPSLTLHDTNSDTNSVSIITRLATLLGVLTDHDPLVVVAYKQWVQRLRLHPYYAGVIMPFGKHKGESLIKVPVSYLSWLIDSDLVDGTFTTMAGEDMGWGTLLRKAKDLVHMTPKAIQDAYHAEHAHKPLAAADALYKQLSDLYDNWAFAMRFI